MQFDLVQFIAYAITGLVGFVVVFCLATAALSATGRDKLAVIGVRVADILVSFFEHWLNEQHADERGIRRP